jgi:putative phosphonate metabolism protein
MTRRYAIYFAPPADSALAELGAEILGRDPETGEARPQPRLDGIDPDRFHAITEDPRHYGFHATLKAPFALAEGVSGEALHGAAEAFAAGRAPAKGPALTLASIGGFLALVPSAAAPEVHALADACVEAFDRFRAPLTAAELERRRRSPLTPAQDRHLERWGYPYVFDEFRFHMTLTTRLTDRAEHDRVRAVLAERTAPVCVDPLRIDAIAVYEQDDRQAPFRITGRYPLQGGAA